jgi:apolipoprotein N-acyltransferase
VRVGLTVAAAVVSALLLWASAPPVGVGWLAWIALVPVAAAALRFDATRLGRLAVPLVYVLYLELLLVPALPFGLADRQWGDPVLPIMVADSPVLFVALVAIPAFGALLYALRFPQLLSSARAPAVAVVLLPAVAWTALDLLRTKFDPGGFWGPLFLSQADGSAASLATLAGPWLITFAIVTVNYAGAVVLTRSRARVRARAIFFAMVVCVVAAASVAAAPGSPPPGTIRVAAVQPGYDTAEFDRPVLHYLRRRTRDLERASLDLIGDLAPLTRDAAERGAAVVVWPEATIWVDPSENAAVRAELARLATETGAVLVVPYFLRSEAQGATVAISSEGALTRPQPKQRPMWFLGEDGGNRARVEPVETDAGPLGTLLGVDNQDPSSARRLAARGAVLLSSSTHDWRQLAAQQQAFARIHAAALRVPIVRADWRFGSAVFDAGGETRADAGLDKRRLILTAEVSAKRERTPYERSGDVLGWACVGALVLLAVAAPATRLRRRASGRSPLRARAAERSAGGGSPPEAP